MTSELDPIKGKTFDFHNLGASDIAVLVDNITTKTVKPHDVFSWIDKGDFYIVQITNSGGVSYELVIWGKRMFA